jgi:hypothetical protein
MWLEGDSYITFPQGSAGAVGDLGVHDEQGCAILLGVERQEWAQTKERDGEDRKKFWAAHAVRNPLSGLVPW